MWFWIMSNAAAVVGRPAIQSTPIIPPRRDGSAVSGVASSG